MDSLSRVAKVGLLFLVATTLVNGRAFAQTDLSGEWGAAIQEDVGHRADALVASGGVPGFGGPRIGDYSGLPVNDAARLKADSWDASIVTLPERQTIPGPAAYWSRGPGGIRISKIVDDSTQQLIAFKIYRGGLGGSTTRVIWMDQRPHPPEYAAHTWQGFSTGIWEGNMLTVETTHVKTAWIQRNGVPSSDEATITEHFMRHGNYLTLVSIVHDPIYLEEPLIRTSTWVSDPGQQLGPVVTEIVDEIAGRLPGWVPHHLPGTNEQLREFAESAGLPFQALRGGKETTYPEYQLTLQALIAKSPKKSSR